MLPTLASLLITAFPAQVSPGTTLVLGGDIMLNSIAVEKRPLSPIKALFNSGNVAIANLEIPLTDARTPTTRKTPEELKKRTQFILKASPYHAGHLAAVGLDMVSLANNHAMDYGPKGLNQMIDLLDAAGLKHTGAGANVAEASRVTVFETSRGTRVGLISALAFVGGPANDKQWPAAPTSPGVLAWKFNGQINKTTRARLSAWIKEAKQECDILVVALHWGLERQTLPTSYQVTLGRACIDEGADIVLGHHPHVLQGAELYKKKPILYSMGNLISVKPGPTGLARIYWKDGMDKFRFLPLEISGGRVSPASAKAHGARLRAFKALSELLVRKYPHKQTKPLY